ncbi:SDR family NAD(P)-dependent oxidoreductase [Rhizobium sp. AC44/96]|uniref:SDR family NAD(P)-dependent oxidoreductase n=1 Tax=Rhizobium sp. AC44/96 TaxID=1841654 RepID=UPI001FCD0FE0|nr:SDR family oxidoreductase [Rhizobium sp. AC44/96]
MTGAAGGLGSHLVRFLIQAKASVLATDIDDRKGDALRRAIAVEEGASRLRYIAIDQSRPDLIAARLSDEIAAGVTVDTLINNAAIYPSGPAVDVDLGEFSRIQTINVQAAVAFMKACVPSMRRAQFGRIINIASNTFDIGFAGLSSYVASKGALIGLAKTWAREFGEFGITVNCVSPGAFPTDAEKIHAHPDRYNQFVIDQQAIKRRGEPADFASLVMFLSSRQAGFITGQNIRVDGGWVMP